jgi:hypothetical protein
LATDGVLLGVEKKISSKLLEVTTSEKMYKVSADVRFNIYSAYFAFISFIFAPNPPTVLHSSRLVTMLAVRWLALPLTPTF